MSLLLICVNYNTREETILFIKSVLKLSSKFRISILVVDNSDIEEEKVKELVNIVKEDNINAYSIHYIHSSVNLGYFGAAQYGLESYLKSNPLPQFVILSNVDLSFSNNLFFQELENQEKNERLGCVSPLIVCEKNSPQNPYMICRPRKELMAAKILIHRYYLVYRLYEILFKMKSIVHGITNKNSNKKKNILPVDNMIYATHGSCFILTENYFRQGGSFNYPCFLYGEELFIAEEMRRLSLTTVYNPNLNLIHKGQISTGKIIPKNKQAQIVKSLSYLSSRYFS